MDINNLNLFFNGFFQGSLNKTNDYNYIINTNNSNNYQLNILYLNNNNYQNATLSSGSRITNTEANITLKPNAEVYIYNQ